MRNSLGQALLEEGRAEGRVEALQKTVLRLARRRFGEPDVQTVTSVTTIHDVDRLERLTDQLLNVSSWQELLDTP